MSKRFKGKACAYCAGDGVSTTADHVFAREFFPIEKRRDLPIVPACEPCNNTKSELEHYLTAVLPFGGRHGDSSALLANDVPRRLAGNQRLHKSLVAGTERITVRESDKEALRLAVPFESHKLVSLFGYIARGLAAYHWNVVVPAGHMVEAVMLNPIYEPHFRKLFLLDARARVNGSVGDGAFRYQGAQGVDDPALTMWRFQAFGGVVMAGADQSVEAGAYTVWVTTGRDLPALV